MLGSEISVTTPSLFGTRDLTQELYVYWASTLPTDYIPRLKFIFKTKNIISGRVEWEHQMDQAKEKQLEKEKQQM